MARILVIDDEQTLRTELKRVLAREDHDVEVAEDIPAARALEPQGFDLILVDLRLPGPSGDTLLEEVDDVPIIVMTAFGTVQSAVDAMKEGAVDYLSKPIDTDELLLIIERVLKNRRLEVENEVLKREAEANRPSDAMIGDSDAMQEVFRHIEKVAPTDATVLILGETGTGKERVARRIHALSDRSDEPFVPVNCSSIPENLIESELFGHQRGAFTGAHSARTGLVESASGGTLFLDEIGELPPPAQAQLLRVLQEREVRPVGASTARSVDVRLLAATHQDLESMIDSGAFREDFYFRLKVFELELPPLSERGDDILELAKAALERSARELGKSELRFDDEALETMQAHPWPGNVRELQNAVERGVILHEEGPITEEMMGLDEADADSSQEAKDGESLEDYFVRFVTQHEDEMTETEIAERLGISRKTLWKRRKRLGIPRQS